MKTFSLGYSPCPNDTFIFYALVHQKVAIEDVLFRESLFDVETLNQMARRAELDITKISYHAFAHLQHQYCLLRSGGALGKGCGPLVVAKEKLDIKDLEGLTIAVPGRLTTAFLLLQIFRPSLAEKVLVIPFDKIIASVQQGSADAGLIIHESRFTYQNSGLQEIIDLGEWWERETGLPIPLGGIVAKRALGEDVIGRIDKLIRMSIEYAFSYRQETQTYIKKHSQEMEDSVIEKHIKLYVNNYSLDIGNDGALAVAELLRRAAAEGICRQSPLSLFCRS